MLLYPRPDDALGLGRCAESARARDKPAPLCERPETTYIQFRDREGPNSEIPITPMRIGRSSSRLGASAGKREAERALGRGLWARHREAVRYGQTLPKFASTVVMSRKATVPLPSASPGQSDAGMRAMKMV
jgi:hypothetical protein